MNREECQAFGQELVRLRRERGVGLDEISRDTKIRRHVIEIFEAGRFEELPPEVFAVGFLRAYAERLGVPADPLVARYRRILRPPQESPPASRRASGGGGGGAGPRIAAVGGVAFLLASALAASWLMGWWPFEGLGPIPVEESAPVLDGPPAAAPPEAGPRPAQGPAEGAPPPPDLPGKAPAAEPAAGGLASDGPAPSAPASIAPTPEGEPQDAPGPPVPGGRAGEAPAVDPGEGDLVLVCSEACWIELWGGGKRLLRREMAPGERLAFQGEDFRADVGNAAGVQVFYRGRPVSLPGGRGRVLKDVRLSVPEGSP